MTTPVLGLDELVLSQASKEITVNRISRQIESRTIQALSRTTSSAPVSPDEGDTYIIPASGVTGEWVGHEDQIVTRMGGIWEYWTVNCAVRLWIADEQVLVIYSGTEWVTLGGPSLIPPFTDTTALVKGSSDDTKKARLEVDGLTAATTRVLTVQNKNYTLAGTDDITTHEAAADPHTGIYQKESEKGAASGYASLDAGTLVPAAQLPALVGDTGSGGTKGAAPAPAAGDAAAGKFLKADGLWATVLGASGGTVTSVAMTVPAELSVSGSPITSSGTLAVTKANQSANQVFAGPTSGGAAAPAFRALVAADIPAQPYDVGSFIEAAPTASQVVLRHVTARAVVFPSSLTGSYGKAGTAATAQTDFDIQKGGVSFGTMRFAAAGTSATFISASGTTTAAGDVITVIGPATPDATLAQITFTLSGTR